MAMVDQLCGRLAHLALMREPMGEYFLPSVVREVLAEPPTHRQGFQVWILLNFALWHYHFVEGRDLHALVAVPGRASRCETVPTKAILLLSPSFQPLPAAHVLMLAR